MLYTSYTYSSKHCRVTLQITATLLFFSLCDAAGSHLLNGDGCFFLSSCSSTCVPMTFTTWWFFFFFFLIFLIILHVSAPQIKKQVERCNYKKGGLPGGGSPLQRDTRHLAKTRPRKKLRMDPNRNYLQLPIKEKQNKQGEREEEDSGA